MKTGYLAALTGPLRRPVFRALWLATVVSNIGTLMHGVGAAWLMTSMTTSPLLVGLVPAAVMLPTFLVGLWGGVLADLFERRRILILTQSAMMLTALAQGVLTIQGRMSPELLLALTFGIGLASALNLPAWQSQIQDIVPRDEVAAAVSLNSMSFNTARAVGPAVGGLLVAASGPASVFLINAASYLGTVAVLFRWKPPSRTKTRSGVFFAMREGFGYVLRAPAMRAPLVRVSVFAFGTSAVWAVLPLLSREILQRGPGGYGLMLAAFGMGSLVIGGLVPGLRRRFPPDAMIQISVIALSLVIFGLAVIRSYPVLLGLLFLGGVAWVGTMVQFNVSVQTSVPAEFRGRAMSFYLVFFQGSMGIGSACNGWIAEHLGIPHALLVSGFIVLAGLVLQKFLPLPAHGAGLEERAEPAVGGA